MPTLLQIVYTNYEIFVDVPPPSKGSRTLTYPSTHSYSVSACVYALVCVPSPSARCSSTLTAMCCVRLIVSYTHTWCCGKVKVSSCALRTVRRCVGLCVSVLTNLPPHHCWGTQETTSGPPQAIGTFARRARNSRNFVHARNPRAIHYSKSFCVVAIKIHLAYFTLHIWNDFIKKTNIHTVGLQHKRMLISDNAECAHRYDIVWGLSKHTHTHSVLTMCWLLNSICVVLVNTMLGRRVRASSSDTSTRQPT